MDDNDFFVVSVFSWPSLSDPFNLLLIQEDCVNEHSQKSFALKSSKVTSKGFACLMSAIYPVQSSCQAELSIGFSVIREGCY